MSLSMQYSLIPSTPSTSNTRHSLVVIPKRGQRESINTLVKVDTCVKITRRNLNNRITCALRIIVSNKPPSLVGGLFHGAPGGLYTKIKRIAIVWRSEGVGASRGTGGVETGEQIREDEIRWDCV